MGPRELSRIRRAVFLDRDGTIARYQEYCCRPEAFHLLPGAAQAIRRLNRAGFAVIVTTNQSGIARGLFTQQTLEAIHQKMRRELSHTGARIDAIYVCPHHPDDGCACRKPGIAMFHQASAEVGVSLPGSYVVGDRLLDVASGRAAGCTTVLVHSGHRPEPPNGVAPDHEAPTLREAVRWILRREAGRAGPGSSSEAARPGEGPRVMSPYAHRMIFQHHEVFGQWHVPNLRAYVPHERGYYIVRTNGVGMRSSRDYTEVQPAGVTRVLLFGDSFTAGEGVHNEERFSDLLEGMLEGVEVLNFGLDGSGTDQQVLLFETLGSRFGGDLILFCPLVENIRRVTVPCWPVLDRTTGATVCVLKPYFSLENSQLQLHNVPVPRKRLDLHEAPREVQRLVETNGDSRTAQAFRQLVDPLRPTMMRWSRYQPFPQYDSPEDPAWRLTWALLERLVAGAGDRIVVLAPLPLYYYIEGLSEPVYLARYREFARAHPSVHLVDLLSAFQARSPAERRRCRYRHDEHYTPLGHRVVASALATELTRLGLLRRMAEAV